jgi:dTDP-4-dehydrorhamnose 3,5-epimerase-like enzyme
VTLEFDSDIFYKCTAYHAFVTEIAFRWDSFGINWSLSGARIHSDKDGIAHELAEFNSPLGCGENL